MKKILWSEEKNSYLKATRWISFEEIRDVIVAQWNFDGNDHYNTRFAHQGIFELEIRNYTYLVPFVQNGNEIFLKTAFPSRKYHYKK